MPASTVQALDDERGMALIVTLMAMSLMLALGLALTLTTITELRIAAGYRRGVEARYAVDAALARAIVELSRESRWDDVLNGSVRSTFVDGPVTGGRALRGGGSLDLRQATSAVRCGRTACTDSDLVAITDDRPWGANNPVWQPYAYGSLDALAAPGRLDSAMYVMVWVGDDPSESDDDPLQDGGLPPGCNPETEPSCADRNIGRGVIVLLGRAFGPDDTQRTVMVTLARPDPSSVEAADPNIGRVISWRESR